MSTTIAPTTFVATPAADAPTSRATWKLGLLGGAAAAVATTAVAGLAHAADVSLAVDASGKEIPVLAFGQVTLFFALVGIAMAYGFRRFSSRPRTAFLRTTVVLTLLSFVPDVLATAGVSTKAVLMLTHVVAAALIVPALASSLRQER